MGGKGRRIRAARGKQAATPVAPPSTNVLWIICCQQGPSAAGVRVWWDYANNSNRRFVVRMNGRLANTRTAHERQPPARLNTLDDAVTRARQLNHVNNTTLVMFMHGVSQSPRTYGIVHGPGSIAPIDTNQLSHNPNWNAHVLPFMWSTRNQNVNYTAFVQAIRACQNVSQIHLYGCRIGDTFLNCGQAIFDFAVDTGKEVWAYQNFTHTTANRLKIIETRSATTASQGARQSGTGFTRVTLEANHGPLPGWQVHGRTQGGTTLVDIVERSAFGLSVITHNRATLTQMRQNPVFANPLSTTSI